MASGYDVKIELYQHHMHAVDAINVLNVRIL